MSNEQTKKTVRTSKKPKPAKKKPGPDDWLSPLLTLAGATVGAIVAGPPGAVVGGSLSQAGGKVAAKAAGLEETPVTQTLDKAAGIGGRLAGSMDLNATDAGAAAAETATETARPVPAIAQEGVALGTAMANQQAAQSVANEGLNASQTARTPYAQMLYQDAGASVPAGVQPLPEKQLSMPMAREEAIGVVPGQGYLYDNSQEAVMARNNARIQAAKADIARRLQSPGAQAVNSESMDAMRARAIERELYSAALEQQAQQDEFEAYKFGLAGGFRADMDPLEERRKRALRTAALDAFEAGNYP